MWTEQDLPGDSEPGLAAGGELRDSGLARTAGSAEEELQKTAEVKSREYTHVQQASVRNFIQEKISSCSAFSMMMLLFFKPSSWRQHFSTLLKDDILQHLVYWLNPSP